MASSSPATRSPGASSGATSASVWIFRRIELIIGGRGRRHSHSVSAPPWARNLFASAGGHIFQLDPETGKVLNYLGQGRSGDANTEIRMASDGVRLFYGATWDSAPAVPLRDVSARTLPKPRPDRRGR